MEIGRVEGSDSFRLLLRLCTLSFLNGGLFLRLYSFLKRVVTSNPTRVYLTHS